jgi:uracil-DNA glycosylase
MLGWRMVRGRGARGLAVLREEIVRCRKCPRLVAYLADVARKKKREFADWTYWGRPVPGFGDPAARLLVVGLAPAAHGGARTGRAFTGDSSGLWLMRALHKQGFASIPRSESRDDGLELRGAWIGIAGRCAPPDNKPLPEELAACRPYLVRELQLLPVEVVVALGRVAFDAVHKAAGTSAAKTEFAHGAEVHLGGVRVIASYHPSRQNTNTGKLTEPMLDAIFARARALLGTRG